jgi:DNA-binding LacI/PurR family transcriptional regulator
MDDEICADILRTLERSAWVTPGEVKIYSFADNEIFDSYRYPVAALRFDAAELGQIACRELLRCLRDETYDPKPILGYRIIER